MLELAHIGISALGKTKNEGIAFVSPFNSRYIVASYRLAMVTMWLTSYSSTGVPRGVLLHPIVSQMLRPCVQSARSYI